jgi:hypothetical protein
LIKEIDSLPSIPGLAGIADTDQFPLNDAALIRLGAIVAMLDEVPTELLQGPERSNFMVALEAIKTAIDRFKSRDDKDRRRLFSSDPLRIIPPFGLNPVALLKRSLVSFPNYTPKQLRRRLLEALASYQGKDIYAFIPDSALCAFGVDISEGRKHLKILQSDGMVETQKLNLGAFKARLTPEGWKALEGLDQSEQEAQPTVFISCGQYSPEEIDLGKSLAAAVDELSPCRGYFAQNQSSLEGLSRHIFGALNRCVGFVAVLHHRGRVTTLDDERIRASVWIEQEIAIAAFLAQAQGRNLPVAIYIQKGTALEGVRQQLLLGAVTFENPDEVLNHLKKQLREGLFRIRISGVAAT